jgi:hypothetical protein
MSKETFLRIRWWCVGLNFGMAIMAVACGSYCAAGASLCFGIVAAVVTLFGEAGL